MSIQGEIDRIKGNVAGAYSAVADMGGTLPEQQNSGGLEAAIRSIPSGGGGPSAPLDPVEVYNATRPADWLPMPEPTDNEMYLLFLIPAGVSSLLAFTVTCTGSYTVALGTVTGGQFVQQSAVSAASGDKYEAELFADDFGGLTSNGMKQVMVRISGTDIITWEPSTHSKKASPADFASWNIVEIACRLPMGNRIAVGNETETLALRSLRYFSWYGGNSATDMNSMFIYCFSLMAILQLDTANVANMNRMLSNCFSLIAIPELNTGNVTDMGSMFDYCNALTTIPELNTINVTNMNSMFNACDSLTTIPQLNTSNVTDMGSMFNSCSSLTAIPQLDTSNVADMNYMFMGCYDLTAIPPLDTSNVTDMSGMFDYCCKLTVIPQLDTSNVTDMSSMFNACQSLTTIPQLDTGKVTSMNSMFSACQSLTTIPQLDTGKVTSMNSMFSDCYSLMAIPELNTSSVEDMDYVCYDCSALNALKLIPTITDWEGADIRIWSCSLGHKALLDLFDSLPTITAAKELDITDNPGVSELTDAEKAIATNKNWTLTL